MKILGLVRSKFKALFSLVLCDWALCSGSLSGVVDSFIVFKVWIQHIVIIWDYSSDVLSIMLLVSLKVLDMSSYSKRALQGKWLNRDQHLSNLVSESAFILQNHQMVDEG